MAIGCYHSFNIMTSNRKSKPKCPTCKRVVEREGNGHFPFCSERCRLVDLGKWLDGDYAVPGSDSPSETEFDPSQN